MNKTNNFVLKEVIKKNEYKWNSSIAAFRGPYVYFKFSHLSHFYDMEKGKTTSSRKDDTSLSRQGKLTH